MRDIQINVKDIEKIAKTYGIPIRVNPPDSDTRHQNVVRVATFRDYEFLTGTLGDLYGGYMRLDNVRIEAEPQAQQLQTVIDGLINNSPILKRG